MESDGIIRVSARPIRGIRRRVFRLAALALGILLAGAIAEVGARLYMKYGYSTFVFRQHDEKLGTSLVPGSRGRHRWCWDGYVEINQYGMRDKERTLAKDPGVFRIGIFGDSIMESVHVYSQETSSYLLEDRLNVTFAPRRFEVLNFSVASFSTVQQFLRYRDLGRDFDLDLALVVSIPNDLVANIEPGDVMAGSFYYAPHLKWNGNSFSITAPQTPSRLELFVSAAASKSAAVLFAAKFAYRKLKINEFSGHEEPPEWAASPIYELYDSANPRSIAVWNALHFVLEQFLDLTRRDETDLAVVFCSPDDLPWYPDQLEIDDLPPSFVPEMMRIQFERFGNKNGVPVYDLGADLATYVRTNDLGPPYLSFKCDDHFNPEGQWVISESLFNFLVQNYLVPQPQQSQKSSADMNRG